MDTEARIHAILKSMGITVELDQPIKGSMDSLDLVEMIMMVEKEFNILVLDSELAELVNLRDVVELVDKKKAN
jgi:acyl carrier protein